MIDNMIKTQTRTIITATTMVALLIGAIFATYSIGNAILTANKPDNYTGITTIVDTPKKDTGKRKHHYFRLHVCINTTDENTCWLERTTREDHPNYHIGQTVEFVNGEMVK